MRKAKRTSLEGQRKKRYDFYFRKVVRAPLRTLVWKWVKLRSNRLIRRLLIRKKMMRT